MKPSTNKGVFERRDKRRVQLYTQNIVPGTDVYGERLIRRGDVEYREWNPSKSKLGAGLAKGLKKIGFGPGDYVLYLGAASGTTVSHISDIVGKKGLVFAVEFSPRVLRELVFVAEDRKNIVPILADANKSDVVAHNVVQADVLFQDIAQKAQVAIFLKNLVFLKPGGYALLALKARSIDVTKEPRKLFAEVKKQLAEHIDVVQMINLAPYEKDHCLFLCKK